MKGKKMKKHQIKEAKKYKDQFKKKIIIKRRK
jgi:hypothetical protein